MNNYNYSKLFGIMKERRVTQRKLAEVLGKNVATLNLKLSGRGYFTQPEIAKICDYLCIPENEISKYFFTH